MIFFEDDKSFSFHANPFNPQTDLSNGLWLTLVGITKTPPHVALISEGKYYSLSARKVDCGSPLERYINTIERKHIPTLFIRIEIKNNPPSTLEKFYKNLQPLCNAEDTCLSPIKDFFAEYYSNGFVAVNYVFELLALAQKQGLIQECVSLFCEETPSNIITLQKYTMAQIKNTIYTLTSQILLHKS